MDCFADRGFAVTTIAQAVMRHSIGMKSAHLLKNGTANRKVTAPHHSRIDIELALAQIKNAQLAQRTPATYGAFPPAQQPRRRRHLEQRMVIASNQHHSSVAESGVDACEPTWIRHDVVIAEDEQVGSGLAHARMTTDVQARLGRRYATQREAG